MPKTKIDKFPSESELKKGVDLRKYSPRVVKLIKNYKKNVRENIATGLVHQNLSDSQKILQLEHKIKQLSLEN